MAIILVFVQIHIFSCCSQKRVIQNLQQLPRNWRVIYSQYLICFPRTCNSFCFSILRRRLFYKEVLKWQNFLGTNLHRLGSLLLSLLLDNIQGMVKNQTVFLVKWAFSCCKATAILQWFHSIILSLDWQNSDQGIFVHLGQIHSHNYHSFLNPVHLTYLDSPCCTFVIFLCINRNKSHTHALLALSKKALKSLYPWIKGTMIE